VLEYRSYDRANPGLALIRDGNATRSFETLMRYRSAAMAELMRALKTLKALQAERATGAEVLEMLSRQPRVPARVAFTPAPNAPERRALNEYVIPDRAGPGRALHEPAASWTPNEPETEQSKHQAHGATASTAPGKHARHGVPGSHGPHEQMPNRRLRTP
jgi:hypothetical protein